MNYALNYIQQIVNYKLYFIFSSLYQHSLSGDWDREKIRLIESDIVIKKREPELLPALSNFCLNQTKFNLINFKILV
jgi:hypothetical protein